MCHNWDFRRHLELKDSPLRDLDADHKLALLRRIAWRMQEGEGLKANAIEEHDLRAEIERYFEAEWSFDRTTCIRCSREMIDVLQRRNHILCPYGPGLYGFIHRTLLEYLCAAQITWRFEKDHDLNIKEIRDGYVIRHCRDDAWHEVIRLLTAQLQPQFARELITALVPVPAEAYRQTAKLQLAFECLAEREPREVTQLAPLCDSLLDALYAWAGDLPDFLQGKAAILENFQFVVRVSSALAAVGAKWLDPALGRRGLPRFHSFKAKKAKGWGLTIAVSLAGSIWSKLPETQRLFLDRASNDADEDVRYTFIGALAKCFPDVPQTLSLLLDRARNDEYWQARIIAIEALAEHFRDAPQTQLLLLDRARNDADEWVREVATEALAELLCDVPETRVLLLDRARNDEHWEVRDTAIEVLGEHLRDAPQTEPLLLDRARNDEHPDVRRTALISWAQAYSNEMNACLLSRDVDGLAPGLDPREPVSESQVEQAADRLGLTPDEVRATYEELARQVPLTLSWQTGTQ